MALFHRLADDMLARRRDAQATVPAPGAAPVTEADIATLPPSVQQHLRRSGAIGRPPVRCVQIVYEAEMKSGPDKPGLPGPAWQFDLAAPPWRRLFFMRSRMAGLPIEVLHDYAGSAASMRVRVARLADVVNQHSDELARTETVTLLNDLCFFAPTALLSGAFAWRTVDAAHVEVEFTNGPYRVAAVLEFDAAGDLVDFASEDRSVLRPNGRFERLRWTTPMRDHRTVDGRRVPMRGEAIWHPPEGPFVYGRFVLRHLRFDEAAQPWTSLRA